MKVQQGTQIEFGALEQFDLSDVNVLEGVDSSGSLLDLSPNNLRDELGGELCQSATSGLTLDDLNHLLAYSSDLGGLCVCGLLDLVWSSLGERNGEQSEEVVVGSLDGDISLNEGLPFSDKGSELVRGEVEAVEICETVLSLDLVDSQLDLAESMLLILLEIGKGNLENSSLKGVIGVL